MISNKWQKLLIFSFIVSDDFESNEDSENSLLNDFKEKIDTIRKSFRMI